MALILSQNQKSLKFNREDSAETPTNFGRILENSVFLRLLLNSCFIDYCALVKTTVLLFYSNLKKCRPQPIQQNADKRK